MLDEELIDKYPRLFHMAQLGSFDSIRRHGLLSTSSLLDLFEISGASRHAIEACRRPESVEIEHVTHGRAVIRDNKPITDQLLGRSLSGMAVPDWYRLLNSQVFFWLTESRLERLLCAEAYKAHDHTVLTLDTAKLVERHRSSIRLSAINSGAIFGMKPAPRGTDTFLRIEDYPFESRRSRGRDAVVELAVIDRVPDVAELTVDVAIRGCGETQS